MVAKRHRTLLPGTEYTRLITPSLGGYIVRMKQADTSDTLRLIQEVIGKTLSQTKKLAPTLRGSSLQETCRNIWNWVYQHIQYKIDRPGHEEIRHPARIWADRITGVDCDDYTVMISSILTNLGIPHKLRMTDYGKGWQHIYVVVPKNGNATASLDQQASRDSYITLDCVTDAFDFEVPYVKKQDTAMTLNELNGLPVGHLGHGEVGNIFKKIGNAVKKVAQGAKKVVTTPIRLGILAWMKLNIKQAGKRYRFGYLPYNDIVAKAGYGPKAHTQIVNSLKRLIKTFVGLGGDHNVLRASILTGKGNKDRLVPPDTNPEGQEGFHGLGSFRGIGMLAGNGDWEALQQITGIDGRIMGVAGLESLYAVSGLNGELGIAVPAVVAAATAILEPILKMLKNVKSNDPGDPIPDEYQTDDNAGDGGDTQPVPTQDTTAPDEGGTNGLGAVKKKAAQRIQTVSNRVVANGKSLTPAQQKGVKKAKQSAPKTSPSHAPQKAKAKSGKSPLKKKPTVVPGGNSVVPIPPVVQPGASTKPQAQLTSLKQKLKAALAKKDPKLIASIQQQIANLVKRLVGKKPASTGSKKPRPQKPNPNSTPQDPLVPGDNDWQYMHPDDPETTTPDIPTVDVPEQTDAVPITPTVITPSNSDSKSKAQQILDKVNDAVDQGTMTVDQAKKIYDKVAPTTSPSSSGGSTTYDDHEVVDSSTPITDPAADTTTADTTDLVTTDKEKSALSSLGPVELVGIGVGALILGKMLFGKSSPAPRSPRPASAGSYVQQPIQGFGKRRKKKKATSSKRRKSRSFGAVPLQD